MGCGSLRKPLNPHEIKKTQIENLPHLKPILWGGFSPNPYKNLTSGDQRNIVAGYVHRLSEMMGGHWYPFFVEFPDNLISFLPNLHGHFAIASDVANITSEQYRAARNKKHGFFMVRKYDYEKYGIVYMYQNHRELRFGDVFCRNGAGCRHKQIHQDFDDAKNNMYRHW